MSINIPSYVFEAIHGGRCGLFLGAGSSASQGAGATNDLITFLGNRFHVTTSAQSLRDLSQYIEETSDRASLIEALREFLSIFQAAPNREFLSLLSLPWTYIITTNYDNLIEVALETLKRPYARVVDNTDVTFSNSQSLTLIKLHGSAEQASSIVITDDDYLSFRENKKSPTAGAVLIVREDDDSVCWLLFF